MRKDVMFFGGIPTEIEVKQLREAYPDESLITGKVIPYSEIEEIINVSRSENRWRTITGRWRRIIEKEMGIILAPDPEGTLSFKVYLDGEKVVLSRKKIHTAGRYARRSYMVASKVNTKELTSQEKVQYDHYIQQSVAILNTAKLKSQTKLPEIA